MSREKAPIRYFCVRCPFEISQEDEERCRYDLGPYVWSKSLDLSLHKPRSELNAEEKKAWKTAKNARAKMEATELAGLCSNRVKEILACKQVPFSQASDYQSGKVADKRGDKFCSQDALRMIRNQLNDDSSDDE